MATRGPKPTEKYGTREKRVSKTGNPYYYYYKPIYTKVQTPYKETNTAISRLARFAKKWRKVKLKGVPYKGLSLLLYVTKNDYPVRKVAEIFGFSPNYAHRNMGYVKHLRDKHQLWGMS